MVHVSLTYLEHVFDKTCVKHIFKNSKHMLTNMLNTCALLYGEHMCLFMLGVCETWIEVYSWYI